VPRESATLSKVEKTTIGEGVGGDIGRESPTPGGRAAVGKLRPNVPFAGNVGAGALSVEPCWGTVGPDAGAANSHTTCKVSENFERVKKKAQSLYQNDDNQTPPSINAPPTNNRARASGKDVTNPASPHRTGG